MLNEFMRKILFLPPQGTELAKEVDHLHYFVITVTMLGSAAVGLACVIFMVRYRRSRASAGAVEPPSESKMHTRGGTPYWVELIVVVGLLSLFTVWWIIGFGQLKRLQTPPDDAIDVYVMAKKWMWTFAYSTGGGSKAELFVPVDQPVRLVMTSRDVIHSFYVPAFRVKQDVVPGEVTTTWFEATKVGDYEVLCAEYCGAGHSNMRAVVHVLSQAEYEKALAHLPRLNIETARYEETAEEGAELRAQPPTLADMGERVAAQKGCFRCHTVDGTPHIGPTWAGLYGSVVRLKSGQRLIADAGYLTESMMDPNRRIVLGFPAAMPSYQGLLSSAEIGALIEYMRVLGEKPRRESPLPAPVNGQPANVELPRTAPTPLDREEPVGPLRGREDEP